MKKFIAMLSLVAFLGAVSIGCGSDYRVNGKLCPTYGLINAEQEKCQDVKYKVIVGNVVWSVVLFSTIIAPVFFLGFSIYEVDPREPRK